MSWPGRSGQRTPDAEALLLTVISALHTLATEVMIKPGVDHTAWATTDRFLAVLRRRSGRGELAYTLIHDTAAAKPWEPVAAELLEGRRRVSGRPSH